MKSAYLDFNMWIREGNCPLLEEGLSNPFQRIVPQNIFYTCFDLFYQKMDDAESVIFSINDSEVEEDSVITHHNLEVMWKPKKTRIRTGRIIGYKDKARTKRISNASTQGTQYLTDIRYIEKHHGIEDTFEWDHIHYDFEMFMYI